MPINGRACFALVVGMLGGCAAVGPDFVAPTPSTPDRFADPARGAAYQVSSAVTMQSEPDPRWWTRFDDAELTSLIDRAVAGNLDLQQALLRIVQARLEERAAAAAGFPTLTGTGSYMRDQLGLEGILKSQGIYDAVNRIDTPDSPLNNISPGLSSRVQQAAQGVLAKATSPVNLYQIGFDASWELDLFGRVRRSVEAAHAQTDAAIETTNDGLVSLEAEVAQTYIRLRGSQQVLRIIDQQIALSQTTLDLVQSRANAGLESDADVNSARAQLLTVVSGRPAFEQQIGQATDALAVLTGNAPGTLDAELGDVVLLPPLPSVVPVGLPSSLARRRPDVRAAEAQLHAATAGVGVAVAQLFPDISLTGQFGLRASQANYLTRWASRFYSFGPSISIPIFEGGALVTNVKLADVSQAQAALAYRSTVLNALRDAEDAMLRFRTDQAGRDALAATVAVNRNAFDLALESWRHGIMTFINVIDAQRQLSTNEQQLAQATVQTSADLVALYKALGGGWQPYEDDGSVAARAAAGMPTH